VEGHNKHHRFHSDMAVESRTVIDIGTAVVGTMMIVAAVMAVAVAVVAIVVAAAAVDVTAHAILAVVVTLYHHHPGRAVEKRTDPSVEMAMAWMMMVMT
jgi:hypothetical protein